jgi:hypothetical protein
MAMVLLILGGLLYLGRIGLAVVNTPLLVDEVGTIRGFSAKGPKYVMTHYGAAKNHVFFNLLNSVTPGRASFAPWRGKLWSLLAFGGLLAASLNFFIRRQCYLEGGLFFFAATTNLKALEINLAARGYGMLACFTALACFAVWRYFEKPHWNPAILVGVCVVLGTYTVPHYILFGGPLLFLLWLRSGDGRVCVMGIAAAIALALLYAPIVSQVFSVASTYSDIMGQSYPDFNAIQSTIDTYLLPLKPWIVFAALVGVAMAPVALWSKTEVPGRALTVIGITALLFLTICLKLETPRIRTTNFVIYPLLFIGVTAIGRIWRRPQISCLKQWLALAVSLGLLFGSFTAVRTFRYVPKENYLGSAKIIQAVYPKGVRIFVNERPDKLVNCLPKDYIEAVPLDPEGWKKGEMLMLDADFRAETRARPPVETSEALELRVPQGKGGYQALWLVPRSNDLLKWKVTAPGEIEVRFRDNTPVWSLNLVTVGKESGGLQLVGEERLQRSLQAFRTQNGFLHTLTRLGKPPQTLRIKLPAEMQLANIWAVGLNDSR